MGATELKSPHADPRQVGGDAPPVAPADHDDKTMGMLCHLGALAGFMAPGIGQVAVPLVIWLAGRRQSAFVEANGRESLNFQITVTVAMAACVPLVYATWFGLIPVLLIALAWLVFVLIGSLRTSDGIVYRYPLRIEFLRRPAGPAPDTPPPGD